MFESDDNNCVVNSVSGDTLLHLAVRSEQLNNVRHLVDRKVNLEVANNDGKRPLHEAALTGSIIVGKLLIDAGCQVDSLKRGDWTPLMMAATKNKLEMIRFLIEIGNANVNLRNKDGWTAFHVAIRTGNLNIVQYFLHMFGRDITTTESKNKRTVAHTAALHGHDKVLQSILLLNNELVNKQDTCGTSPFMDAIRSSHIDVCKTLIQFHCDYQLRDNLGRNALHVAAECGSVISWNFLVNELKFDPNCIESRAGFSCLHIAAREGQLNMISFLLNESSIDANIRDFNGRLPVDIARMYKKADCVKFFENIK